MSVRKTEVCACRCVQDNLGDVPSCLQLCIVLQHHMSAREEEHFIKSPVFTQCPLHFSPTSSPWYRSPYSTAQ